MHGQPPKRRCGSSAAAPWRSFTCCTWVCWPGWRGTGWDSFGPRSSCPRRRSSSARWCASSLTARGPTRRWALRRFSPRTRPARVCPAALLFGGGHCRDGVVRAAAARRGAGRAGRSHCDFPRRDRRTLYQRRAGRSRIRQRLCRAWLERLCAGRVGAGLLRHYAIIKRNRLMKKWTAAALAALTALTLTGCSFQDVMLYLYGGDSFVTSAEPDYTICDGDNGVTVVYDQNQWEQPVMAQDDTLSLTTGNQLSYTVVLLQTTDTYTDFLAPIRSGAGGDHRHGQV